MLRVVLPMTSRIEPFEVNLLYDSHKMHRILIGSSRVFVKVGMPSGYRKAMGIY